MFDKRRKTIEANILNKRFKDDKRYMYKSNDMNWFGGYTELFSENIIKLIL